MRRERCSNRSRNRDVVAMMITATIVYIHVHMAEYNTKSNFPKKFEDAEDAED